MASAKKAPEVDLSQFEETPIRSLKKANKEDDERAGSGGSRGNTLKLVDGTNTIRFAPKRKGEGNFYIQRKVTWLPNPKEDGSVGRKPFDDSVLNAGTKYDIISEYLKFAQEKLPAMGKTGMAKLGIITNRKGKDSKAISPKPQFTAYAWLKEVAGDKTTYHFGQFEFGRAVRDGLENCTQTEDPDEEIDMDPFTSIKEGHSVLIKYNSKATTANDYYKVALSKKPTPLNQEMLLELQAAPTLTSLYRNTYGLRDFESALVCLTHYDTENGIDLCDLDEWDEIVEKVRAQYSGEPDPTDDDDEDDAPKSKAKAKAKPVAKGKPAPADDDDDDEDDDDEDEAPAPVAVKGKAKAKPAPVEVDDDDDDDEDEEEEEAPAPKGKKAAPAPKGKGKAPVAVVEDDDDDDDDEEEDDENELDLTDDEDDDDDDDTPPPPPAAKKNPAAKVADLKKKIAPKKK